jgi:hypothetical protein
MDENFLTNRDVYKLIDEVKLNGEKIKALVVDNEWKLESIRIQLQRTEERKLSVSRK